MRYTFFLLFVSSFIYSYAQSEKDSLAQVVATEICDCAEKINVNEIDKINERGVECTNSILAKHFDPNFFNPQSNEEKLEYAIQMDKIGVEIRKCERIIYLQKIANIYPNPKPEVSEELFLTTEFLQYFGLEKTEDGDKPGMKIYDGPQNKERIQRFVDIRWEFETNEDALKYHRYKLNENSEGGRPIEIKQEIGGIQELKVFEESEKMREILDEMKLDGKQYYFIFVKGKVLIKLFFGVPKDYELINLIPFVQQARDQIKE
ncbi:MAG: hypothetical protein KDC84_07500 [Crocinitomicaceae bacterium]|nr:hypothetical protein [Crocinitomicaceae bacterium]